MVSDSVSASVTALAMLHRAPPAPPQPPRQPNPSMSSYYNYEGGRPGQPRPARLAGGVTSSLVSSASGDLCPPPPGAVPSSASSSSSSGVAAPPGDSDTDSGICADSEQSASSPRHPTPGTTVPSAAGACHPTTVAAAHHYQHVYRQQQQKPPPSSAYHRSALYFRSLSRDERAPPESLFLSSDSAFSSEDRDYLTPNSARRLFESAAAGGGGPRRLPRRPTAAEQSTIASEHPEFDSSPSTASIPGVSNGGNAASAATLARNGKPFRVRFADQIGSGSASPSLLSTPSTSSNNSPATSTGQACPRNAAIVAPFQQKRQPSPPTAYDSRPASAFGYRTPLQPNGVSSDGSDRCDGRTTPPQSHYINYDVVNGEKRFNGRGGRAGYSIDDVEGLPEPPSYSIAVQRLGRRGGERGSPSARRMSTGEAGWTALSTPRESVRDSIIRQSIADTIASRQQQRLLSQGFPSAAPQARCYRNRSSSLPRGRNNEEMEIFWHSQMSPETAADALAAASMDNLHFSQQLAAAERFADTEPSSLHASRRRLPALPGQLGGPPLPSDSASYNRRPAYSRQRRCRAQTEMVSRRSASVGRYPSAEHFSDSQDHLSPINGGSEERSVRAQLVALDHRGFRTVLIEKVQPGPFGFYIATGLVNNQRGIFISRVSIASLSPILSIGDEIIYVDDELVKGRSLEYVQSLIAGKTSVTITLQPTVGPSLR